LHLRVTWYKFIKIVISLSKYSFFIVRWIFGLVNLQFKFKFTKISRAFEKILLAKVCSAAFYQTSLRQKFFELQLSILTHIFKNINFQKFFFELVVVF
jgi:hypothetical protein